MRRGEHPTYSHIGSASRRTEDGWDFLGDAGSLDEAGHLTIVDRVADLIVSDGVDIYPAEIERVLEEPPLVHGAVAYGVPDERLGRTRSPAGAPAHPDPEQPGANRRRKGAPTS